MQVRVQELQRCSGREKDRGEREMDINLSLGRQTTVR